MAIVCRLLSRLRLGSACVQRQDGAFEVAPCVAALLRIGRCARRPAHSGWLRRPEEVKSHQVARLACRFGSSLGRSRHRRRLVGHDIGGAGSSRWLKIVKQIDVGLLSRWPRGTLCLWRLPQLARLSLRRAPLDLGLLLHHVEWHVVVIAQCGRIRHGAVHDPSLRLIFRPDEVLDFRLGRDVARL